ncbi:hypothetical protein KKF73_02275 [Patescibacteria group bacterium]|nr:hypothetical protein [Patescibacteria group bacterium]
MVNKENILIEKAESLIDYAKINAVGTLVPILDELPNLNIKDPAKWDIAVTVAGIFIALSRLNDLNLQKNIKGKIQDIITKNAKNWNKIAIGVLDDCKNKFEKEYNQLSKLDSYKKEQKFLASDSIGIWIAWNVLDHQPKTEDEIKLVRLIGSMVVHFMYNYWNI